MNGAPWYILFIFICLGMFYLDWTKPVCTSGYVPTVLFGSGWNCVPGYKPGN
jgi:hypothetical protein